MQRKREFDERRAHDRIPFAELPWTFCLQGNSLPADSCPTRVEACDISLGGIRLLSNQRINIFSEFEFQLHHNKEKVQPITIRAKIVRIEETDVGLEEKKYSLAAEFVTNSITNSEVFLLDLSEFR